MFREWLTKKASKTVETAIEPTKKAIQHSIEQKSDWMTKLLRLGLVGFLTLLAFREEPRAMQERVPEGNTRVVINNYIYGKEKEHDSGTETDQE